MEQNQHMFKLIFGLAIIFFVFFNLVFSLEQSFNKYQKRMEYKEKMNKLLRGCKRQEMREKSL